MKEFLVNLTLAVYMTRFKIYALVLTCAAWLAFAKLVQYFIGQEYLDLLVYALVGWFWLGGVVMPWVQRKLEHIFDL